jgi:UDP-3-O-acyl N-acetylglucosamine deacetylase
LSSTSILLIEYVKFLVKSVYHAKIPPMQMQSTVARTAVFRGRSLFTNVDTAITFKPAEAGSGVIFRRTDLNGAIVRVHPHNLIESRSNCTIIKSGDATVSVVEHVLACLTAMRIDNVEIDIDAGEVPAGEGCAADYIESLENAGRVELDTPVIEYSIQSAIIVGEGDRMLVIVPADEFSVTFILDHPHKQLGLQAVFNVRKPDFMRELIPARTFITEEEAQVALKAGLLKHNERDRAVIIGQDGPNRPLIYPNEPARHKAQDIVGDLSIFSPNIKAHFIGIKSGHQLNRTAARRLAAMMMQAEPAYEYQSPDKPVTAQKSIM